MRSIFLCAAIVLYGPTVIGCEIEIPDVPILMNESSAIFAGTLLEEHIGRRESIPDTLTVFQTFTVDVERIWKGNVPRRVVVSRMDFHEQCVGSSANFKYQPNLFASGRSLIIFVKQTGLNSYSMLPFGYWDKLFWSDLSPSLSATYGPGHTP